MPLHTFFSVRSKKMSSFQGTGIWGGKEQNSGNATFIKRFDESFLLKYIFEK